MNHMDAHAVTHPVSTSSRELVLDAAHRLIVDHGYAGLSMRELARESGIAKGTIYHHFADKRDIYLSVLERDILAQCERMAAAAADGDFRSRLTTLVRTYFGLQMERRGMLLNAIRDAGDARDEILCLVGEHREQIFRPAGDAIRQGIRDGLLRPVDVEMAVISLYGMMNSFIGFRMFMDKAEIGEREVQHIVETFIHGIAAPP